jgi:hypothetical protein
MNRGGACAVVGLLGMALLALGTRREGILAPVDRCATVSRPRTRTGWQACRGGHVGSGGGGVVTMRPWMSQVAARVL